MSGVRTINERWVSPPPIVAAPRPKWFTRPMYVLLVALPILIALTVPAKYLLGSMLAYANVLIIVMAMIRFTRQQSLQGVLHILFLTWMLASWPLASLYLAMTFPGSYYQVLHQRRFHLDGMERLQLAMMAFLLVYVPITLALSKRGQPFVLHSPATSSDRRTATAMLFFVMSAILLNAVSKIVSLPEPVEYVAIAGYNYLHSLMLLVGALFPRLPFYTRALALAFMGASGAFYMIGNHRGAAALPLALFLAGLLFFSEMRPRWKMGLVITGAIVMPLALALGDITRDLTKTSGFSNFEQRIEAFSRLGEYIQSTPLFARSFQRTFSTGGHTLVTMMPEPYPYLGFSFTAYVREFFERLIPGKLYYHPYYSTTALLRTYDFYITDKTSVELSFIGSLYMLGGFIPIIIGTIFIALVHCWFGRWIGKAQRASPYKGLFYCGMLAQTFLWGQNLDPISHFRTLVWQALAAAILYYLLVRILIGERRQTLPVPLPRNVLPSSLRHPVQTPTA